MKGVSEVVVVILVLIISVSAVISFYSWATGTIPLLGKSVEQMSGEEFLRTKACLKIDKIYFSENNISVRNCGSVSLSNFAVYIDDLPVDNAFPSALEPMEIKNVTLKSSVASGAHTVKVISNYAAAYKSETKP